MRVIDAEQVHTTLDFPRLIEALRAAFAAPAHVPRRTLYRLEEREDVRDVFALLPAWNDAVIAVKAFTYLPGNAAAGREILHSAILVFDRPGGELLALVDGTSVTFWRTAGIAALAADYLARRDASRLLVCGTGNLAPYVALAHAAVRPLTEVAVWGRRPDRAAQAVERIRARRPELRCRVVEDLRSAVGAADMVCCVTGSHDPIVFGEWVREGTHVGLFGNHERTGRECDTELVAKARLYVDSRANVLNEAGEILIPIAERRIDERAIVGELAELCAGAVPGRTSEAEVTVFKSVGTALGDLAAARLVVEAAAPGAGAVG